MQNEMSRDGCAVKQPEQQELLKSSPTTKVLDALSWLTSVAFGNTGSSPMEGMPRGRNAVRFSA